MQSDDSALTTAESGEKTARIGADVNLASSNTKYYADNNKKKRFSNNMFNMFSGAFL